MCNMRCHSEVLAGSAFGLYVSHHFDHEASSRTSLRVLDLMGIDSRLLSESSVQGHMYHAYGSKV